MATILNEAKNYYDEIEGVNNFMGFVEGHEGVTPERKSVPIPGIYFQYSDSYNLRKILYRDALEIKGKGEALLDRLTEGGDAYNTVHGCIEGLDRLIKFEEERLGIR